MQEPSYLTLAILIAVCLACAVIGLYFLANFKRLFRGVIRNETVRRNVAAWLVICFISAALTPMGGGIFYVVKMKGWWSLFALHFAGTTINTLFVYNIARLVAESKALKRKSFAWHKVIVVITIMAMVVAVNLPMNYVVYNFQVKYLGYSAISSLYLGAATGLVYTLLSYLDIERKRKFDEKELELSRLRELKTKAELDALHSKVNPHFLYNALNSIADLSITDGKKARRMTVALADLFRYSINYSNNNYSTLKEEIEMAEVYLLIEKIRFEDQLNYKIEVDEELRHYLVPRFLLQPVVENAVKHGLKATGKMTEILLTVQKTDEGMTIRVRDNGPAFPEQLLPGYGVKSMFDKLELLFPGAFEVAFHNEPVKQVSVSVHKLLKHETV